MKHIVFTVTNDLSYDQRMDRICSALSEAGYQCTLIGRQRAHSIELADKPYKQVRLQCSFEQGKLFYIEYNLRLRRYLRRNRFDLYCAIDLDSALPVYFAARREGKAFVYDAHEYFSELEEIVTRPFIHFAWQRVEQFIMKRFDVAYTISEGYARLFHERYHRTFSVIRNVPLLEDEEPPLEGKSNERPYLIYQGALNIGRGLEASILAMKALEGIDLKIFGDGPMKTTLEELIQREGLGDRVSLEGAVPPDQLRVHTRSAFAGLTIFSHKGLHHQYSLANRFFDYFHAGIPQLAIDHPEYRAFNANYPVAVLIDKAESQSIVKAVRTLQSDSILYRQIASSCLEARKAHNWQIESKKLIECYAEL
jgi:glycosyltransferase involved in cell wall biosynthesis